MKRKTQLEVFKSAFPHVDLKTTQGMLMFQGFLGGYERGIVQFQTDRISYKTTIKTLKGENSELMEQLKNLNILIKSQEHWQRTGEEHP